MSGIIDTIAKQTNGICFQSHRYCHDTTDRAGIEYDDNTNVEWKDSGETERPKKPIDLKAEADHRRNHKKTFRKRYIKSL